MNSSSEYYTKKSWRTGKTSGWAAIDLKQRRKSSLEPYNNNEPFPPISNSSVLGRSSVSLPLFDKPFVSVVHNPLNFMTSENVVSDNSEVVITKTNKTVNGNDRKRSELKSEDILKECYPWADGDLIDDVLAGVNNDFEQASDILKGMLITDDNCTSNDDVESEQASNILKGMSLTDNNRMSNDDVESEQASNILKGMLLTDNNCTSNDDVESEQASNILKGMLLTDNNCTSNVDVESEQVSNILKGMLLSTDNNCTSNDDVESEGHEHMYEDRKFNGEIAGNSAILNIIQNYLNSIPLEPEWEEDDVYWIHRKDASKMMRSAARHSKAANDYYLKGEHALAQKHSLKAKEEWTDANSLNDIAAKSILRIRNAKNDLWTLDLHGLHAFEAVKALDDHLRKIENAVPHVNQLKSTTNIMEEKQDGIVASATTYGSMSDMANVFRRPPSSSLPSSWSRPRRPPLQVITGKGIHSRGEASLPLAIRTFLIDNGYQFDETRPGMITVRPKYRV